MHGFLHARQALLAGTGSHGSLIGGGGDLGHGAHQIPGSGGDLTGGRADFRGGGGGFGGGGLLLLGRRGDLGHRRGHLHRRALGLGHQRSELGHHVVEPGLYRAEFVLALQVQAAAEVAGAHDFEDSHDAVHRRHDGAHQQQTTESGRQHRDHQGNTHDDFGCEHCIVNGRDVCVRHRLVVTQDFIDLHSTRCPGRGQFTLEHVDGLGVLVVFIQLDHRGQNPVVVFMKLFERGELDPVFLVGNRSTVEAHLLFQPLGVALEVRGILGSEALPFLQAEHGLNAYITVGPRATNHRAVIQPWQSVLTHAGLAFFDLQQPRIRDNHHQQHDGDNYRKARQNALA
ncbi:hypothetical protein D9M71_456240 [compost metagenome]